MAIGVTPVKEELVANTPGSVPVFFTTPGIGVVPVDTVAEFVAGVVPIRIELAAGIGIVNVTEVA